MDTTELIAITIHAISALLTLAGQDKFSEIKGDIKTLVGLLTATLPKKADGTPYTDEDIHEAAANAIAQWQQVSERAAGAQG